MNALRKSMVALAISSAALLSACGGGSSSDDGPNPTPTPSPSASPSPNPSPTPSPTPLTLEEEAQEKIMALNQLSINASQSGIDVTRAETVLWFAEQFLHYADWDEANPEEIQKFFYHFYPYREQSNEFAAQLPDFERQKVVDILTAEIETLSSELEGEMTRRPVAKIDWYNVTVEQDQFVSNGKPVFLYDYFSKSMGNPTTDTRLYNDHLGNVDHLPSINPFWLRQDGSLAPIKVDELQRHTNDRVGYALLWNSHFPQWMAEQEPEIAVGRSLFTGFDIDNPLIRDSWGKIIRGVGEMVQGHKGIDMGVILSNEPHWFSEAGHWTQNYGEMNAISSYTLKKFQDWLSQQYKEDIESLNNNWGTQFTRFDSVAIEIPINPATRGTPIWYDWCRFNMDRVTNWFEYLQGELHKVNPEADTSIKIMPDLFTENNRSHGIDLEALTSLTTMIGDDAKTRGRDLRSTQPEHWEAHYAYFWEELAVSYDFMESVAPNKIHVNSETHFLSSSWWRDLGTSPNYVRNSFWLATLMGMDAGLSWFWARDPDGSPERRLEGDLNFFEPAMAGSYAASVNMQPQVANALTQVMYDLNSHADEIMALRKQRRPLRIFYSETSAINKTTHMSDLFEIYEPLFFEGFPIGYATQKIIETQDSDQWDAIAVYKTEYVTDAEFDALQSYLDGGGTIILDSTSSLSKNEYGEPRETQLAASQGELVLHDSPSDIGSFAALLLGTVELAEHPILLSESNGLDQNTCTWRAVPHPSGTGYLVTIVNLGKNSSLITLRSSVDENIEIVDLLHGKRIDPEFEVPTNGVMLLEVRSLVQ